MHIEDGFYSIIEPNQENTANLIDFTYREFDGYSLSIVDVDPSGTPYHHVTKELRLDRQQLTEFGALLLYLGGEFTDLDSIPELLRGYGVSDEGLRKFAKRLVELTESIVVHT